MTVSELIEKLKSMPEDAIVYVEDLDMGDQDLETVSLQPADSLSPKEFVRISWI